MLRHRILLIFTLGIGLLALALTWTAAQRDRLIEEQVSALATRGQSAVWRERTAVEALALTALADEIASSPSLAATLADGDRDDVASASAVTLPEVAARTSVLEIVDAAGRQLYSEAERLEGRRPLDLGTLAEFIGGRRVTGLRQDGPDTFLILHAFPLALPDGRTVAVTIGGDAAPILRTFARALDADAFLVNPRGRAVVGTDPALWERAAPTIPLRRASFALLARDGRRYILTAAPVADLGGGQAALAVTLRDGTAPLGALVHQRRVAVIGVGLGFVALLLGMHLYLRRAFRPLDAAIDVLDALARGVTRVRMEARGQAEIGRIASAVARFRRDLV